MPDSKIFVARSPSRRRSPRRTGTPDRRAAVEGQNLPTVTALPVPIAPEQIRQPQIRQPQGTARDAAAFAAQVLGQDGQKRGLRGGPETLDKARSSYLETEWSGPADRRPRAGGITKTEV